MNECVDGTPSQLNTKRKFLCQIPFLKAARKKKTWFCVKIAQLGVVETPLSENWHV